MRALNVIVENGELLNRWIEMVLL